MLEKLNKTKIIKNYEEYLQRELNFQKFSIDCAFLFARNIIKTPIFSVSTNGFLKLLESEEIVFPGESYMIRISFFPNKINRRISLEVDMLRKLLFGKKIYLAMLYGISKYYLNSNREFSFRQTALFFNEKDLIEYKERHLSITKTRSGDFKEKNLGIINHISFVRNLEILELF